MQFILAITLLITFAFHSSFASTPHLILKSDFNNDGIADRVVFASYEISGFFQSTNANKKIDTFFVKQGNRTAYFTSNKNQGGPFIKLTEDAGFFTVTTVLKLEKGTFNHVKSFLTPGRVQFSDDLFVSAFDEPAPKEEVCGPPDAFNNKPVTESKNFAEELKKHSIEDTIKKAISPDCKKVFGDEYPKMEKQIVSACNISDGTPEQNDLVSCLDKNVYTREFGGRYKQALAAAVFENGFKISCSTSTGEKPVASYNSSSKEISLFQTTPAAKNRNFKADFFHEMMHDSNMQSEDSVQLTVQECLGNKSKKDLSALLKKQKMDSFRLETSQTTLNRIVQESKDGSEVSVPAPVQKVQQTSVASAVNESAKTLDSDFSMNNEPQYHSLASASRKTFGSMGGVMEAAYRAAVPSAFASATIGNSGSTTISAAGISSAAVPLTTTKGITNSRSIASAASKITASPVGASYDISALPDSVSPSPNGELGNGMAVKAAAVNIDENSSRSPAAIKSSSTEVASGGGAGGGGVSTGSRVGSLAALKTTDRPDLRNNVPQLKSEDDFLRTLTTGKYAEVKAKLTDPANQKILEDKKIQYVAKDQTLGSKQPVIILKDLGNKFSILRVNVE